MLLREKKMIAGETPSFEMRTDAMPFMVDIIIFLVDIVDIIFESRSHCMLKVWLETSAIAIC